MTKDVVDPATNIEKLKGQVNSFDQVEALLPKNLPAALRPLLISYFEAQLSIKRDDLGGANTIFETKLNTNRGYLGLEEENPQLLAAIDMVVRGDTTMVVGTVKPEFSYREKVAKH